MSKSPKEKVVKPKEKVVKPKEIKDKSASKKEMLNNKKPAASKPVVRKAVAGKAVAGKAVGGKAVACKPVAGKAVAGKAVACKAVAGKAVAGKSCGGKLVSNKPKRSMVKKSGGDNGLDRCKYVDDKCHRCTWRVEKGDHCFKHEMLETDTDKNHIQVSLCTIRGIDPILPDDDYDPNFSHHPEDNRDEKSENQSKWLTFFFKEENPSMHKEKFFNNNISEFIKTSEFQNIKNHHWWHTPLT